LRPLGLVIANMAKRYFLQCHVWFDHLSLISVQLSFGATVSLYGEHKCTYVKPHNHINN